MSRKERRAARVERIRDLLEAGDHRAAGAEARALAADGAAPDGEREAARAVLASLRPDPGVLAAAALGVIAATALAIAVLAGR
jgi:hypothetical protein